MAWIAGVDGCKAGWIATFLDSGTRRLECGVFPSFAAILGPPYSPQIVAVDMPIGLADTGQRQCDVEARRLLQARRSSVFPPPIRPVLHVDDYPEVNASSKELHGKGLSKQAFYLMPKIREVEAVVLSRPAAQIRECHPELSFMTMNHGRALPDTKHHPAGLEFRRRLLEKTYDRSLVEFVLGTSGFPGVGLDDLYDALAVLWTASRVLRGEAERVPHDPPSDSLGLLMEIVY